MIGNYKILQILNEGAYGKTCLAEHVNLKKKVVVKQFPFKSAKVQEMILTEASLLWDINHWALPIVKDVLLDTDGAVIIVMNYVEGEMLFRYVQENGPLEPETVCWITQRILSALYYLHYAGIVHKDLKPANIIVNFSTHIATLVDFGLPKLKPDGNPDKNGYTSLFNAPEQIAGKNSTAQGDIYSLGMTMIYLTGGNVKTRELPAIPDALKAFILSLVIDDPLKRPANCMELNHVLSGIREKLFDRVQWNEPADTQH